MHLGGLPRHRTRSARARPHRSATQWGLSAVASILVIGGVAVWGSADAFGSGQLTVSPNSGLQKGQIVAVTGTGLPANSKGYVYECNMAPKEPTLLLGSPVGETLGVGCSPPSLRHIVSTNSSGTLNTTFSILLGRKKVGPPCGLPPAVAGCPQVDTHGQRPGQDSQNYPCPPTPKQQVAGVSCDIIYLDASGQRFTAPISFAGGGGPTTGGGGGGGGGSGGGKTTTTKPLPTTTRPVLITTTTVHIITAANTTIPPRTAASRQLAFTGAGPGVKMMSIVGAGMALLGALLWLLLLWRRPASNRR
ncbi:MAG TPA: neocarzinostatin apoprotein domain-containing protein [Acidimicrobiales bacterium]|nr:neocarzinostatin apoprotein domain-containing protein [Acidimicrobiales bacterium]